MGDNNKQATNLILATYVKFHVYLSYAYMDVLKPCWVTSILYHLPSGSSKSKEIDKARNGLSRIM